MYLRHTTLRKNGKVHRYWRLVRSVRVGRRVIQQTVAQLGELDERGRIEARVLARHLIGTPEGAQLFDDGCRDVTAPVRLKGIRVERSRQFGDVYLERKGWWQIWIHQIMRAKVLRHLFKHLPDHIPSAKAMDDLKDDVPKLPEHRLFVTEKNYAVFGESTRRGMITQNCYESIVESGIELPEWFQQPDGEYVTIGKL